MFYMVTDLHHEVYSLFRLMTQICENTKGWQSPAVPCLRIFALFVFLRPKYDMIDRMQKDEYMKWL